jgi:hypothetical protein
VSGGGEGCGYDAATVTRCADRRSLRAPLLIAALVVVFAAACTTSSDGTGASRHASPSGPSPVGETPSAAEGQTYRDHGVSFSYPRGWRRLQLADTSASAGTFDWTATIGIDPRDIVNVSRSTIGTSITRGNIAARTGAITLQMRSLFTQAGGSLTGGPVVQDVAGLPALRYSGDVRTPAGEAVHTRLVLAFAGTTEYELVCQYDDGAAGPILAGCDQVISTFSVRG